MMGFILVFSTMILSKFMRKVDIRSIVRVCVCVQLGRYGICIRWIFALPARYPLPLYDDVCLEEGYPHRPDSGFFSSWHCLHLWMYQTYRLECSLNWSWHHSRSPGRPIGGSRIDGRVSIIICILLRGSGWEL